MPEDGKHYTAIGTKPGGWSLAILLIIWGLYTWNKSIHKFNEAKAQQDKVNDDIDKAIDGYRKRNDEVNPQIDLWECPKCHLLNFVDQSWVVKYNLIDLQGQPLGDKCMKCNTPRTGGENLQRMRKLEYQALMVGAMATLQQEQTEMLNRMLLGRMESQEDSVDET